MLDLRFIRENEELVRRSIADRGVELDLDELLSLDLKRRELLQESEQLKNLRNTASKELGELMKQGEDVTERREEMRRVSGRIKEMEESVREVEDAVYQLQIRVPNVPHESVPRGPDESYNQEVRRWGEPRDFGFEPLPHWELGESLDILDFARGVKIAESRFTLLRGTGARLERALINFMLDLHTLEHGYTEIFPPILVNEQSMFGTGQLPKLEAEMYRCRDDNLFLIPTAEVPVTNIHRDETLPESSLPRLYCAYTPCFRREAGSYGKDTRGLVRQHQFNKVEMVRFTHPNRSFEELEILTSNAEAVLQRLGLPYRVVVLSTGDLSFAAAKCYDLEVWLPSSGTYREISSCSNFTDFQARRSDIRFRTAEGKSQYVHTLNGSGIAIGRTVAALLENYQEPDGSVVIPENLVPYMDGRERIEPPA